MVEKEILLDGLKELSLDKDSQAVLWTDGSKDEIHSFDEAICYVFDDSALDYYMEKNKLEEFFPKEVCLKFKKLDKQIKKIDTVDKYPIEIINDPEMEKIRELSAQILELLATSN
ncbi:MAG: hypothetical protein OEY94_01120 [Alphaproteobacteria bacterium]|nr:hypothetical protein [Alphaproteobacteria bacterium]